MNTIDVFKFLQEEIHTTIMATCDNQGHPVTCAVDIMDYDENGLYFLTAKGKNFYNRLKEGGYLALTGIHGESTMTRIAVSVCGKVREIGEDRLQRLLDKNPYMYEIYPSEQSRKALSVFCLYEGKGEWFDLSKKPMERFSFAFGGEQAAANEYFVTDDCVGCGKCRDVCPQNCIDIKDKAVIRWNNCLHCGNCVVVCPVGAVTKR